MQICPILSTANEADLARDFQMVFHVKFLSITTPRFRAETDGSMATLPIVIAGIGSDWGNEMTSE